MTSPPVVGFVLLALYYLLVYLMTRRRSSGSIIPRNAPPDGISAAGVRYIVRKGVDDKNFVIAILELIALRALRIKHNFDQANSVRFEQLVPDDQGRQGLQRAPLLTQLLNTLFGTYNRFVRGTRGDARLRTAQNTLTAQLHLQYSDFLATNEHYARWGTGLWLLYTATCLANVIIQGNRDGDAVFALMALLIGMALLTFSYGQWRERGAHRGSAILSVVFGVPILIAGIAACVKASAGEPVSMLSVLLPAVLLPIVRRAFVFLRSYTEAGSALMESIAGFKQTLSASTGSWLGALATQDDKLRLYERYLPYAIALDVGQQWGAAFGDLANSTAFQTRAQSYGIDPTALSNPSQTVRHVGHLITPAPAAGTSTSHATSGGESGWYGGGESSGGFFSWGGSGDGGGGDGGGDGGGGSD